MRALGRSATLAAFLALLTTGCGDARPATSTRARQPGAAGRSTPAQTAAQRREITRRRRVEAPRFGAVSVSAARDAVLAGVRRSILRDARRRARRGELRGHFRDVDCSVDEQDAARARRDPHSPVLRFSCLAVSYRSTSGPHMVIGRPFAVRVDFARRRWAACLFTPVGGEGTHLASTFAVTPSPACVAAPPR